MQVFHDLDSFPPSLRGGAVSIGKFDGIHLGHALILQRLTGHAARLGVPAVVLTFEPAPIAVLRPDLDARPICTPERKIELIGRAHVDATVVFRTDLALLRQSAETFFFETLQRGLEARIVVEGRNFSFGRDRIGNVESIRHYGRWAGIEIDIVEPIRLGDEIISSSGIRRLLREGKIEQVNELMPQPYRITGTVVDGKARGRRLGFPTANLSGIETIIPKPGLYASLAHVDGRRHAATTHLGPNPTFGEELPKAEVFLHDFQGDLYGRRLDVDLLAYLREIVSFDSPEELVRQMERDVRRSGEISAQWTTHPAPDAR